MTASGGTERAERRVLVVEDRAHRPFGHYPTRFASVAEGFAEIGCVVEVLTSNGWLHEGARPVPFVVRRFGFVDRWLGRAGEAFRTTRGLRRVARSAKTIAMVRAARTRCRRAGSPRPAVVVVSTGTDAHVACAHAGAGRWLFYEFADPITPRARLQRRAAGAEARRRGAGGAARVVVPDDDVREHWEEAAPYLQPITLPIAGSDTVQRIEDARLRLGISADENVALLFGGSHASKDVDLVARVFADLPDWQVVVCGRVADSYRQRTNAREAVIIGGYVDDNMRALVFSAADLVVLSYQPGFRRGSGALTDAIAFGVPVVCSDGSLAASIVREYGLGNVFAPGNPDSLERAIATAPARIDPEALARARAELSSRAVARHLLEALSEPRSTERGAPQ
ncbi:MAG TPA: glycosyltransferase family 4 protein [Acidimicrobiia bacterium]|nr:glycosyltransferase family 4 protein [Acidimicrobiia bacterium]